MAVNQDVKVLQPNTSKITPTYLLSILIYEADRIRASCAKTGTTVESIETGYLKSYKIPLPPLEEQRSIADILSKVDEQIQQTDEIIETLSDFHKGLRQDLYRGRFSSQERKTHTTLGEYPCTWDVTELSSVADVTMGSSPKSEYYNDTGDGVPFFQGSADFGERNPDVTTWCTNPSKMAEPGDILMSVRAPVGDLNITTEKCCIGRGLAAISPTDVDSEYLYEMLQKRREYLVAIASGSTFESINGTELRTLDIIIPPEQEQNRIGKMMELSSTQISQERVNMQRLREFKRGLMQDLLTGNVRVDPQVEPF